MRSGNELRQGGHNCGQSGRLIVTVEIFLSKRVSRIVLLYWKHPKPRICFPCWSQWLRGPKRRSAAARLLRSWVRIPPGAWMIVCCECCVLSGRGLCDELITSPEESYRVWWVVVCDLETSRMRRPWLALVRSATWKKNLLSKEMFRVINPFLSTSTSVWTQLSHFEKLVSVTGKGIQSDTH